MESNTQEKITAGAREAINPDWLVCFTGNKKRRWWWDWLGLTDRHFRHCYILQYQPPVDKWILLDWTTGQCDLIVIEYDEVKYIFNNLKETRGVALLVRYQPPAPGRISYRLPVMYCVQACLHVLAQPMRWTFTPRQLYNRLIKQGAKIVLDERTDYGTP